MTRILVMVGAAAGGGVGWWLGERVGIGTAFSLAVVGTALGTFAARRFALEHLEV